MPNIEALAKDGLTFNHAFSNSPVCSVARSTLATSMLAPRGGFQYHRKSAMAKLPPGYKPWSAMLRKAGYFTTNQRKTDYNFVHDMKELWDRGPANAAWRARPSKETPFFHMQSFAQCHESSLHFKRQQMDLGQVTTSLPHDPDRRSINRPRVGFSISSMSASSDWFRPSLRYKCVSTHHCERVRPIDLARRSNVVRRSRATSFRMKPKFRSRFSSTIRSI